MWMSVESAEMAKHAINAFLANSIVFINEIATLCEAVGADAREVEQGLKSDERIGPRAYLGAGGPFAGGTLARDVMSLILKGAELGLSTPLIRSIRQSNEAHKAWPRQKLTSLFDTLEGKSVAVLGLTYKPGTNTLRRSAAVELCEWLSQAKAKVRAYDPVIARLPEGIAVEVTLCGSALDSVDGCDAVIVATEWPVFREFTAQDLATRMKTPIVLDPNRFLEKHLGAVPSLRYFTVGKPAGSA
jgi:UDPglucose 6-dehydrogenase